MVLCDPFWRMQKMVRGRETRKIAAFARRDGRGQAKRRLQKTTGGVGVDARSAPWNRAA